MTDSLEMPAQPPAYLKLFLGLPRSATVEETRLAWSERAIPLLSAGPQVLIDEAVLNTMLGGLPAEKATRIFKQTARGQALFAAAEKDAHARAARATDKPPFVTQSLKTKTLRP